MRQGVGVLEQIGAGKPEWMDRGACKGCLDLFFPERGQSTKEAKAVCWGGCPVREICLEYALDIGVKDGIWGGMSERQRRRIRSQRRQQQKREAAA